MIARTAVSVSRADGIAAAVGMGVGGALFAVAALLGLHAVLLAVPSLYVALKVAGGLYLAWLGLRIWMFAKKPLAIADSGPKSSTATRSFSGLFRNRTLGGYRALATDPERAVVLALPGRKCVITPDNPKAFVDHLKRDHSKVLGRRSIAELR